ncbi:hypothetical protein WMO79_00860 [Micrococcaceae bacterium Sec7.4]
MNGGILWLVATNIGTLIFLIISSRSTRYWIKACQTQITKRWQDRLPVDKDQIATLLEEHRIRWVNVPDPDRDERMPDVGKHLPECPTCGPMTGITDASTHQAVVLAIHLNKGQLRSAAGGFVGESRQAPAESTAEPAQHHHRIEVEIDGSLPYGLKGDITFKGVCDAGEGAACRMWCNDPGCREEAGEDHESHVLVDQGECGVIGTLNADPSMIPELYEGPTGPLRPDFIELDQDIDGVTWRYVEGTAPGTAELASLANRILIRRRRKCQLARTHTAGHCKACGVHQ